MQRRLICAMTFLLLGTAMLLNSCSKKKDKQDPLVITPTVNPIPYSVMAYFITPSDKTFNPDYYRAARSSMLNVQNWYKTQLGKTFTLNPVDIDTLTSSYSSSWFTTFNGDSVTGPGNTYGFNNTIYALRQQLGGKFDTTHFTYIAFVMADFPDETKPKGVAAEGVSNLAGLSGQFPESWMGADAHALAHAFGLPEPTTETSNGVMSVGWPKYPNCVFTQTEKDYLNTIPFLKVQ